MTRFLFFCLLLFASARVMAQETAITAQFNRAVALQQQGKFSEAADEYRAVLKQKPDYAEAHANLGVVLTRLGKYDEAVVAYEKAYQLAPQLTPILLNLGIVHYRANQFAKAADTLQKFLAEQPENRQARSLYGLSLIALERDAEGVAQLEQTLAAGTNEVGVFYSLGLAYLRLGKPGVRVMLEKLADAPGGLPLLHLLQGQAFLRDQEYEQAIEELQAATKLNPDLPRLHFSLGLAHFKLGHYEAASAAFANELQRAPQDFLTLYYVAAAFVAADQLDAAHQPLRQALSLKAESPEANGLWGKVLCKQGKAAEAVKPLEFAVAHLPNEQEFHYWLARVYQQLGRREEAARELAEVQQLKAQQLQQEREKTPKLPVKKTSPQ